MRTFNSVGKRAPKLYGHGLVTGREQFSADISLPHMLNGRILRSLHPHARIVSIDTSRAERAGAVCVTYKDVPQTKFNPRLVSTPETTYKDWSVLSGEPVYFGEPIAAVAAETEEEAQRALDLIKVEYEVLGAVFDAFESIDPEALLCTRRFSLTRS